jgi:bacterioferritin-associated ferredoxin
MILRCLESFQNGEAGVIVCSCNRISAAQILAARDAASPTCPFSPGKAYKSLGCKMQCGSCLSTVRALLSQPSREGCVVTGQTCSANPIAEKRIREQPIPAYAIAAE